MRVYSLDQAEKNLGIVLDQAREEGAVRIRRGDGSLFVLQPESPERSPLDVPGVDLGVSADEIVEMVREGRERQG
jgi:hypothetical protein